MLLDGRPTDQSIECKKRWKKKLTIDLFQSKKMIITTCAHCRHVETHLYDYCSYKSTARDLFSILLLDKMKTIEEAYTKNTRWCRWESFTVLMNVLQPQAILFSSCFFRMKRNEYGLSYSFLFTIHSLAQLSLSSVHSHANEI